LAVQLIFCNLNDIHEDLLVIEGQSHYRLDEFLKSLIRCSMGYGISY
jgi:hypothetical protein